ncbi:uncharacterized protein NECHADRAFT_88823 [Fusarium vanettenii 77-13-4]|uniref:Uncharacterized protein n=1 Tax=Fusarium vanettenii (strain ATCC MYA-4622 / CBS 123669 / FGSC 9596 / NRRL 45880 / 77-13-4) TaxID=660122 RepID=C7ZQ18_FUSV7|nr:uncharacterized protein NECHADRAFT_88823 [Fusarium vanettenii 77-13-4]EEU33895.1 hypothetical protein NECHADRAFT_88823 [Fusarium vanettenii 77-13-4]
MGQIEITTAAPHQFGVSDIDVALNEYSERPFTFSINMASRVMSVMASIKSKDDLKSFRTEAGKQKFDHIADEKLEASAVLLSNFDKLKKAAKDDSAEEHAAGVSWANSSVTLADWNGDQSEVDATHSSGKKSWFGKALDVAVEYIGDAIEFLRKAVKFTVKWAIKIAGPIVKFIVRVGSKVLSIMVKTAVTLVRSVVGVLDNLLGTDMMGWLGLHFGKHIPNIQNRLKEVTLGSLDVLNRFLITNRESLLQFFEDAEDVLFGDLQNAQEHDAPREESSVMRFVRSLLNSPIIKLIFKFNPISWIMEGASEDIEEAFPDWKLPNFGPLAEAIGLSAKGILEIGLGAFMELFSVISMSATDVLTKPRELIPILIRAARKMFKEAFDATRDLALLAFDTLIRVVMTIPAILTQAWKIPGLTDLWEDWIGQEFSLINFATYGIAVFVDLVTVKFTEAQKDKVFGQPFGEQWTQFDIEPMYRGARRAADQAALAAKYPGPSLPEHTNPMVMMMTFSDAGKGDDDSRRKEEEKQTLQNTLATSFAFLGYGIGTLIDVLRSAITASGSTAEQTQRATVQQKWFLGVSGTIFNVSCAAISWQVGENCQAIGNLMGAGAVIATHGLSNNPTGLKITLHLLL